VPGGTIWPLSDAVIGPGAAIAAIELASSVFVPAPSAALEAILRSPATTRELPMPEVRALHVAESVGAVPPVPATGTWTFGVYINWIEVAAY
jgi:hypothetical protein